MKTSKYPHDRRTSAVRFGSLLLAASFSLPLALAQNTNDPAPAGETKSAETVVLDPYTVTSTQGTGYRATNSNSASRLAISVKELPLNVSILTRDFMDDIKALTLQDVTRFVPGVEKNANVDNAFSVRGFPSRPLRDGFQTDVQSLPELALFDRVEVVKGPASLLYSITSPGGVVNMITKTANNTNSLSTRIQLGNDDYNRNELDANWSFWNSGDRYAAMRFIYAGQTGYIPEWGPYYHNERNTFAGLFRVEFSRDTSVDLKFSTMSSDVTAYQNQFVGNFPRTMVHPTVPVHLMAVTGPDRHRQVWDHNYTATIVHEFSDTLSLRVHGNLITSNMFNGANTLNATRETALDSGMLSFSTQHTKTEYDYSALYVDLTKEFRTRTLNGMLLFGAEYTFDGDTMQNVRIVGRPAVPIYGRTLEQYLGAQFPADFPAAPAAHLTSHDTPRAAYVINKTSFFNDRLTFFGGVRHVQSRTALTNHLTGSTSALTTHRYTTLQAGLSYKLTDSVNIYAVHSPSVLPNSGNFPDNPQKGQNQEVGLKVDFLGGRASGEISVFNTTLTDIESTIFVGATPVPVLSGKQRTRGVEASLNLNPVEGWSILVSYARLDAEIVENTQFPQFVGISPDGVAENYFNLWAKYRVRDGSLKGLSLFGGLNYKSSYRPFINPGNYLVVDPGYTRGDAGIAYEFKLHEVEANLGFTVTNLTDKLYTEGLWFSRPRQYIVSLDLKF